MIPKVIRKIHTYLFKKKLCPWKIILSCYYSFIYCINIYLTYALCPALPECWNTVVNQASEEPFNPSIF